MYLGLSAMMLLACHTGDEAQGTQETEGLVHVRSVIPDWDERAGGPFFQSIETEGSDPSYVAKPSKTFSCTGKESRQIVFGVGENSTIVLKFVEGPQPVRVAAGVPRPAAQLLDKVRGRTERLYIDGETSNERDRILNRHPDAARMASIFTDPVAVQPYLDGWLLGFATRYQGGLLLYIDAQGESRVVSQQHTNAMVRVGDLVYGAHGSHHIEGTDGSMSITVVRDDTPSPEVFPTPAAVYAIAEQNGVVAGLMSEGIIVLEPSGTIHLHDYNPNYERNTTRLGFLPDAIGFLPGGEIWLGGENIVAVFDDIRKLDEPHILVPEDCKIDLGARP